MFSRRTVSRSSSNRSISTSSIGAAALQVVESLESRLLFSTITVTNAGDTIAAGDGVTLREAITAANSNVAVGDAPAGQPGTGAGAVIDRIEFNIPGAGVHTISPTSVLPDIVDPVVIDGYTQPGAAVATAATPAVLQVELEGTNAGVNESGFTIRTSNSVIRGLAINRFSDAGISVNSLNNESGNRIEGNYIGTDPTGMITRGNGAFGIYMIFLGSNTIGGTTPAARNVISGNKYVGAQLDVGSYGNQILGNYIGTNALGTAALGSQLTGISFSQSGNNVVGGILPGSGNLISGNIEDGILIGGGSPTGNETVLGNRIGTDVNGAPLGNGRAGILIDRSGQNVIGGSLPEAGNIIAFNGGPGVHVTIGSSNSIRLNSIYSNGGLGIDLTTEFDDMHPVVSDGPTPNDPQDADGGANDLQNFPLLTSATPAGTGITIQGGMNSTPAKLFYVDFYASAAVDPSGFGEGQTYLGSQLLTTDAAGNLTFNVTLPVSVAAGAFITATATTASDAPRGDTSEFSPAIKVASPPVAPIPPSFAINDVTQGEGNAGMTAFTFTLTRSGDLSQPGSVQYSSANGTATAPGDYAAATLTTVNFIAGQATAPIAINVVGDTIAEADETFFVNLVNPGAGSSISDAQGMGTITNDDVAPPATAIIAPDPAAPGKMALIITGTDDGEYIDVDPGSSSSKLKVEVDDVLIGEFNTSAFDRIYVYAKGGDDRVAITTSTTKTAVVFGGDGQDQIKGGSGKDILLGEAQNDIIRGRKGRDIIIGGAGADGISGDEDDDLIIAAATTFDADLPGLFAFQKEWVSSNSYSKRRDNVRNGTGSNVGGRKLNDASILEDAALDLLSGNSGTDLFFYHKTGSTTQVADKINDKSSSETAVDAS